MQVDKSCIAALKSLSTANELGTEGQSQPVNNSASPTAEAAYSSQAPAEA
jgi:hypothetical protein